MKKDFLKQIGIYAGIVLLFAGLAYGFMPELLKGKIVNQSDISGWKGMAQEALAHNKANPDDPTAWTNSMFGGMPTTATIDDFEGDWTKSIYNGLMAGKRPASYLFITLIGAFLLMRSMGTRRILSIAGAIAMAFCSYNMQIIQVGHNTKMQAIAFFPWVLAGVIFTYRSALKHKCCSWKEWLPKTLLGAVLFALALSMQIKANHIQITYYLAIVIFVFAICLFISLLVNKEGRAKIGKFFAASALLLVIGCTGIATNANKLIPTYEYTPYTMRGGSELKSDDEHHNDKGLSLDYATAWSYGIEEMPNLMIPNFNGGVSTGELDEQSHTGKLLKKYGYHGRELKQILGHLPLYWGPQPFTAGPMYMGAITIFLFILGMIVAKGSRKWWLFLAGIIATLLAWGNHFMWFTELWFEYAPFYNKFRTVSMALVVLQYTLPLLGFYALDQVLKQEVSQMRSMIGLVIAFGLTGFACLFFALIPSVGGSFVGASDMGLPQELAKSLMLDRMELLQSDAFRSFILISIAAGLIYLGVIFWKEKSKGNKQESFDWRYILYILIAISFCMIILFDMWSIGKRYLNKEHFIKPSDFNAQYAKPRPVDTYIKEDTTLSYRVLDLSENTFNSSLTSYHHQSIGGYSPVKLQRYQDLIERYINKEINQIYGVVNSAGTIHGAEESLGYLPVISMLNGKYIIVSREHPPVENRHAMGEGWFVDTFEHADTPDEEIALLGSTDLKKRAILGNDFAWVYDTLVLSEVDREADDQLTLTHYAPNELRYSYTAGSNRPAVFSEIYYPEGWKAWVEPSGAYGKVINGRYVPTEKAEPLELFRVNWILRAAVLPEGEGEIVMRFEPESYQVGANISRACSITLLVLLLIAIGGMAFTIKRKA